MKAPLTLEQQRAQFAWQAVMATRAKVSPFDDFKNLAKGSPALIMGSGLMASLAFYKSRKKDHADVLNQCILDWLAERFKDSPHYCRPSLPKGFDDSMQRLLDAPPAFYMQATDEVLALLKWLRQFADALAADEPVH